MTEPETKPGDRETWSGDLSQNKRIVAWINKLGGEARYEPLWIGVGADLTPVQRRPDRIVITGPDGPVYVHLGDEVVKSERWFHTPAFKLLREFTVRRPG